MTAFFLYWLKDCECLSSIPPSNLKVSWAQRSHPFSQDLHESISLGLSRLFCKSVHLWDDFDNKHQWNIKHQTPLFISLSLSYAKLFSHFISPLAEKWPTTTFQTSQLTRAPTYFSVYMQSNNTFQNIW